MHISKWLLFLLMVGFGWGAIPQPVVAQTPATGSATGSATASQKRQVDALFRQFITANQPGAVVIVVQDGKVLYKNAYGLANLKKKTPLTVQSQLHFGSCGKQFTAMGILLLAEEGLLKLDDPLIQHLPELKRLGKQITIRHLLHHTSGVPDIYESATLYDQILNLADQPTNQDMLNLLSETGRKRFVVGEEFFYSNTGYDLLGSVIERVSGVSYAEFMQSYLFKPLGMKDTFSVPDKKRLKGESIALSYTSEDDETPELVASDPFDNLVGSGSFYTTVEDMALYEKALLNNTLLPAKSLNQAFVPGKLNNGSSTDYGFGWEISRFQGQKLIAHDGSWLGFISYYFRLPQEKLAVVILLNRDYGYEDDLPSEVVKIFLK
ncbi:MAG TPA: serine hydrolase domain-containing protein [Anaerolineales bacterium]|nr:serine hydrolase domain-containing protein [Anaerolineales bacterium]